MPTTDRRSRRARRGVALLLAGAFLAAGAACSDDGEGQGAGRTTTTPPATADPGTGIDRPAGNPCDQGATVDEVEAVPVEGTPSDLTVTSFDGTPIRAHWFPVDGASADQPAPTVLMGPGWSLAGDTSVDGETLFAALGIGPLNEAGYNVLTWDPRGFGDSGGAATVNAPDAEGRDVQVLLDWVAEQPEAQLDGEGDPRSGMVGFSYGGGIQLTVAAQDCRVDALVPGLAWHSLETSLFKADTVKTGWSQILVDAAAGGTLDPHILSASASGQADGTIGDEDREWFRSRGPGDAVGAITVPTLLVQGTVDTLFTLDEALTVHASLVAREVPTKMLWFCGGHGACLTDEGDPERVAEASFAWLDRWVKGDTSVDTGPAFDLVDQDGTRWTGEAVPTEDATVIGELDAPQDLELRAEGGSGPSTATPTDADDVLAGLVAAITPAPATNAVEVPLTIDEVADGRMAVGAPRLRITYAGTVADGPRPTRLFAQLVDRDRGVVVGNQVTPLAVTLDGAPHTAEVDLEVIAQRLATGEGDLVLQIVAVTTAYGTPRLGGRVTVSEAEIQVPLVAGLTEG